MAIAAGFGPTAKTSPISASTPLDKVGASFQVVQGGLVDHRR
jgi:hypothetical protein